MDFPIGPIIPIAAIVEVESGTLAAAPLMSTGVELPIGVAHPPLRSNIDIHIDVGVVILLAAHPLLLSRHRLVAVLVLIHALRFFLAWQRLVGRFIAALIV